MSMIFFNNMIGPVPLRVILTERHSSSLGITELPIETGAKITDHSYVEPKKLELSFADEGAALTYMALVRFQETRIPFNIMSGLYRYKNMMIKEISAERSADVSCILKGTALLQEVILVETARTAAEKGDEKKAGGNGEPKKDGTDKKTDGTTTNGDQPTKPNDSILYKTFIGSKPDSSVKAGPR
jgi:hypothetical protein